MKDLNKRLTAIRGLTPLTPEQQQGLDITAVKKGGYLELDNQTWLVTNQYLYLDVKWSNFQRRKNDYWVTELELYSLNSGETRYVEWEIDDELEVCQTDALLKLRDIRFEGANLSIADLESIADEEEGEVIHNGVRYEYSEDDTWAGLFFKAHGKKDGMRMRAYEFEARDGLCLTIEAWHDDDDERPEREAFLSHVIDSHSIRVLQTEANKS